MNYNRIILPILLCFATFHGLIAQNVGIGTAAPNTKLEVNGDIGWRTWNITLVNGVNNVISPANLYSYYRITGPTAAFSISGVGNPQDGRVVTLYNATTQNFTVQNVVGAAGANGIRAGAADLVIGAWGSVTLQYNTTDNIWVVVNAMNAVSGSAAWLLNGNGGTNDAVNFLGTTDAQDLVVRTNNAEVFRAKDDQTIGVGTGASAFAYPFSKVEIVGDASDPHLSYVSTYPSFLFMRHGGTYAAPTSLANGDNVGELRWYAHNGTSFMQTARILSYIDGPVTPTSVPGELRFMTNTAGNNLTDEKMIIKNNGRVGIGTVAMGGPLARLHTYSDGTNWDTWTSNGDFYVGDATYRFKLGVATGGGGAGDIRLTASGGTSRLMLGGGSQTSVLTVAGLSGSVGINTYDPNTKLDVFGDLALKTTPASFTGTAPNLVLNTISSPSSHYLVNTAAANFNLVGLSVQGPIGLSSQDGRIVMLHNRSGFSMTVLNQSLLTPFANYRIVTGTGDNLTIANGGTVTLVHNITDNRWVVTNYNEGGNGNDWHITGNTGTNAATNFLGTTDNQPLSFRTNNTLAVKINNTFHTTMGVGMPYSNAGALNGVNGYSVLEAYGDGFSAGDITFCAAGNNLFPNYLVHAKARGTQATPTLVNQGDLLGMHEFWGYDGAAYRVGASIGAIVDAAPGANDLPASLIFGTTADGSFSSPGIFPNIPERMRIANNGNVGINITNPSSKLHVFNNANVDKTTTFSYATQLASTTDYDNVGIAGVARGGNATWGYSAGVVGVGDQANSWYAQGVYAGLGTGVPALPGRDAALYVEASSLGYAGIFRGGSVVIDEGNLNTGTTANALLFGTFSGEGIASKRSAGGNQNGLDFYTNATNRMVVTNGGVVGIGTTTPTATRLHVYNPIAATTRVGIFQNNTFDGTELQVGSIEYWHDYSSTVDFNNGVNTVGLSINLAASSAYDLQLANNSAAKPTNSAWTVASDERLKDQVAPFKDGLAVLRQIEPVSFHYNGKAHTPDEYGIGVIAQQVKEVAPYMVGTFQFLPDEHDINSLEEYYSYNPDALHYITLNAVKELDEKQQTMQETFENISDFGQLQLSQDETFVSFDAKFMANLAAGQIPVVTLSVMGNTPQQVAVKQVTTNGFTVKAFGLTQPALLNWIAMAKVKADLLDHAVIAHTPTERQALIQNVKLPQPKLKDNWLREHEGLLQRRANGEFVVLPGETEAQAKAATPKVEANADPALGQPYHQLQKQLYPEYFNQEKAEKRQQTTQPMPVQIAPDANPQNGSRRSNSAQKN